MTNNELVKITNENNQEVQFIDIKRIFPKNHITLDIIRFYQDVMNITKDYSILRNNVKIYA